jgi:hypothetical protein
VFKSIISRSLDRILPLAKLGSVFAVCMCACFQRLVQFIEPYLSLFKKALFRVFQQQFSGIRISRTIEFNVEEEFYFVVQTLDIRKPVVCVRAGAVTTKFGLYTRNLDHNWQVACEQG